MYSRIGGRQCYLHWLGKTGGRLDHVIGEYMLWSVKLLCCSVSVVSIDIERDWYCYCDYFGHFFFCQRLVYFGISSVSQCTASLLLRKLFVIFIVNVICMFIVIAIFIISMSGMRCNVVSQPVPIDWLESWPVATKECIVIENWGAKNENNKNNKNNNWLEGYPVATKEYIVIENRGAKEMTTTNNTNWSEYYPAVWILAWILWKEQSLANKWKTEPISNVWLKAFHPLSLTRSKE